MQTDLFGHKTPQGELFAAQARERREFVVNAETVRAKMVGILNVARAAQRMPWPERQARSYEITFPQMADWLPDDEARQMCFEFRREFERLKLSEAA